MPAGVAPTGCCLCAGLGRGLAMGGQPYMGAGSGWSALHGGWPWLAAPPPRCLHCENILRTSIEGLKPEIQEEVKARQPYTLKVAISFARHQEERLNYEARKTRVAP
ncbi:hypothetical protein GW17_00056430 [Ensete ventricosum]|nr:hypothetical protein GW17_00056430 [Ensete ventricosum]